MKIIVNKDACVGCGACASIAEDLFEIDENGQSTVKVDEVPEDKNDEANDAIGACPTGAISKE